MARVSVIIPVYNKEKFIAESLESISRQSFKDWECLLIDDGSTDNSIEIIRDFVKKNRKFSLMTRPSERRKGASTCRNIGLENSSSDYVQFLDADDTLSEDKLQEQVEILEKNHSVDVVTCRWGRMSSDQRETYKNFPSYNDFSSIPDFLNSLVRGSRGYFPVHAYLMRREVINRAGPWNEFLPIKNDGEFMMRVIANCRQIKFSNAARVWYRVADDNNLSRSTNVEAIEKAIYGLKITDGYLGVRFGKARDPFMEWNKNQFFVLLKNTAPQLIAEHREFFKGQIHNRKFMTRFRNKFKALSINRNKN